jgi:hypothetical protein
MSLEFRYVPIEFAEEVCKKIAPHLKVVDRKNNVKSDIYGLVKELRDNNNLYLYTLVKDGVYSGFIVFLIKGEMFIINKFYKNGDIINMEVDKLIDSLAKFYNCEYIIFYSRRRGWDKASREYGYNRGTTEYWKRIDDNEPQ